MYQPTELIWSVAVKGTSVVLRCKAPDDLPEAPWWHVAEILPDGTLVRIGFLDPELGLNLNDDEQIKDYDFESY